MSENNRLLLSVKGMGCMACVNKVEQALQQTTGVVSVKVDLQAAEAEVFYQPQQVEIAQLIQAVKASGYEAIEKPA
jgi:Cu+-exporting ATPase